MRLRSPNFFISINDLELFFCCNAVKFHNGCLLYDGFLHLDATCINLVLNPEHTPKLCIRKTPKTINLKPPSSLFITNSRSKQKKNKNKIKQTQLILKWHRLLPSKEDMENPYFFGISITGPYKSSNLIKLQITIMKKKTH